MATVYGQRWKNQGSLGEGGQGRVFKVIDLQGDRTTPYALKLLINDERLARFYVEAEALASIDHPHVVKLIDANLDSTTPYIVSEYCAGGSFEQRKDVITADPLRALGLFGDICEGVAAAHGHRPAVVHRDLKPANLLLRTAEGPAVVADFGICYRDGDERLTRTQEVMGARWFTAPELEDGPADLVDPRCDVYSLGKVLSWLLSGGKVFSEAERRGAPRHRESDRDLVRLRADPHMEHANLLLDRMITEEPDERYRDAGEVAEQARRLQKLITGRYNVVTSKVPQICMYCGEGTYVLRYRLRFNEQVAGNSYRREAYVDPDEGNFLRGYGLVDQQLSLRILVCDNCGHTQTFYVGDEAVRQKWETR